MTFYFGYVFMVIFGILVVGNFVYISNLIIERFMRKRKLDRLRKNFIEHQKTLKLFPESDKSKPKTKRGPQF